MSLVTDRAGLVWSTLQGPRLGGEWVGVARGHGHRGRGVWSWARGRGHGAGAEGEVNRIAL